MKGASLSQPREPCIALRRRCCESDLGARELLFPLAQTNGGMLGLVTIKSQHGGPEQRYRAAAALGHSEIDG
jgi:hypothetical protein